MVGRVEARLVTADLAVLGGVLHRDAAVGHLVGAVLDVRAGHRGRRSCPRPGWTAGVPWAFAPALAQPSPSIDARRGRDSLP